VLICYIAISDSKTFVLPTTISTIPHLFLTPYTNIATAMILTR
jgi:hypothetical protein